MKAGLFVVVLKAVVMIYFRGRMLRYLYILIPIFRLPGDGLSLPLTTAM